ARPGDGEAVGLQAGVAHEGDVLGPAVVVVAGDVAGAAALDRAGARAERVPDGEAFAVLAGGALDLVGGGGGAPDEVLGEGGVGGGCGFHAMGTVNRTRVARG